MADQSYLTIPHLHTKHIRRIFSKIAVHPVTSCWEWTGAHNGAGYGTTSVRNIRSTMHRFMYAWLVEPIPRGLGRDIPQLDHFSCDNRRCVNPAHLRLVSARENNHRSNGKGAQWVRRTHCNYGHILPTHQNRGIGKGRVCVECQRNRMNTPEKRAAHAANERRRRALKRQGLTHQKHCALGPSVTET